MSQKYEKLKRLLKEMFQLDQPDLDFGLYRIMHAKADEVIQFLDRDLLPQVTQEFGQYKTADKAELERQLAKAIEQAESLGADPNSLPKVKELRSRLETEAVDITSLEGEVYDHLVNFFSRYYSEGDFLSKRRYSRDGRYAIPYDGEEVKLYWANHDQYYIKTSEYLRDYAFRLNPTNESNPMRVHFKLADVAEGEHGNVKASTGKERVFILAASDFAFIEQGELVLRFEYRPATLSDWPNDIRTGKTKPPTQKELTEIAEKRTLELAEKPLSHWVTELSRPHYKADGEKAEYNRLRAHLNRYFARNTFDYFIHKDLGGFLKRELDFYIKNEVMQLDDIENESAPRVEQYLSKIKVIRRIAGKIITFLSQLEDFQKTLWLKKKFVVETQYCVAIKEIPDEFLPEIVANAAQWEEWESLHHLSELKNDNDDLFVEKVKFKTPEFLKANRSLMIDTRHFETDFIARLLEALGDIDSKTDGVLFHSENFQALNMLERRYRNDIDSVYIDPPYNTDATPIIYKNGFRNSSWLSMIEDRLRLTQRLMADNAILCITIDDVEVHNLRSLVETSFSHYSLLGSVPIKNNPAGRTGTVGFSVCHEYGLFFGIEGTARVGRLPHSDAQKARYGERDDIGSFEWTNFRKHGGMNTYRTARPRQYYPIYVSGESIRIPQLEWDNALRTYRILEQPTCDEETLWPIDSSGRERIWDFVVETARENIPHFRVRPDSQGKTAIYRKWRLNDEGKLPQTWWDQSQYSAAEYGTNLLSHLFGDTHIFAFPKSIHAVADSLRVANLRDNAEGRVLDYFAGSGTSGHAAINLNREDGGTRKFLLVEMGHHFDTALLPRLKKTSFTPEWREGKPKRLATEEEIERGPRVFRIVRLESYEDSLNNLQTRRTDTQRSLLEAAEAKGAGKLHEQYLLRYMLSVETQGSQSLLNVEAFSDPTAYRLLVKRPGSDESREVCIDLIETFNWLLGLTVQHIATPHVFSAHFERDSEKRLRLKGRLKTDNDGPYWFRTVTGITPDGRKALVIWRKLTGKPEEDNLVLDEWFTKQGYSSKDSEFGLIFVNGGNNLENLKTPDDLWKVRLIEDDFHRLMFATEGN